MLLQLLGEWDMKKHLLILLAIIFLINIVLSGCFLSEKKTDSDYIIGKWVSEDSHYRQFIFKSDGTCLITTSELEGTYYIIHEEKRLVINQTNPSATYVYEYSFSYNKEKLTLTDPDTFDQSEFRKK